MSSYLDDFRYTAINTDYYRDSFATARKRKNEGEFLQIVEVALRAVNIAVDVARDWDKIKAFAVELWDFFSGILGL